MIADLALDNGAGKQDAALVAGRFELLAASFNGSSETGRLEHGEWLAAASTALQKSNSDPALTKSLDEVRRQRDAARADDDLLQTEEGELIDHSAARSLDRQSLALLAEIEAEPCKDDSLSKLAIYHRDAVGDALFDPFFPGIHVDANRLRLARQKIELGWYAHPRLGSGGLLGGVYWQGAVCA